MFWAIPCPFHLIFFSLCFQGLDLQSSQHLIREDACFFENWYSYISQYEPHLIGPDAPSDFAECVFCGIRQEAYNTFRYDWLDMNIDLFSQYAENSVFSMLEGTFDPDRRRETVPRNEHLNVRKNTVMKSLLMHSNDFNPLRPCPAALS